MLEMDSDDQDEGLADTTIIQYYRIYGLLEARVIKEVGLLDEYGLAIRIGHWLVANRERWRPATFRLYRAAFQFVYDQVMGGGRDRNTAGLWDVLAVNERPKIPKRGPAKKAKRLPPDDLGRLVHELRACSSIYGKAAADFMIASVVFGLRPHEWRKARLLAPQVMGEPWRLVVQNGKQTQGRAHGPARTIHLLDPQNEVIEAIAGTLAVSGAARNTDHFNQRLEAIRKCVQRASRKLWAKRLYCLYSGRHQAAANFKQLYSREEVAALLGHASVQTAAAHYGRRKAGKSSGGHIVVMTGPNGSELLIPAPQPSPQDVAAVLRILDSKAKLAERMPHEAGEDLGHAQDGQRPA